MPWGDARTGTPEWKALRLVILRRDNGICYLCHKPAGEVDHRTPITEGGTDTPANLAAICHRCHVRKSSAEGNRARWKNRDARPPEKHPGMRDGNGTG